MNIVATGGGYFYGPFVSTQGFGIYTITPGAIIGAYGPWSHLPAPEPVTGRGRWLQLTVWPDSEPPTALYNIQIGIGPAGSETVFQPSDGSSFIVNWFGPVLWNVPYQISFPCSIGAGKNLSLRCASAPGGAATIAGAIYVWN